MGGKSEIDFGPEPARWSTWLHRFYPVGRTIQQEWKRGTNLLTAPVGADFHRNVSRRYAQSDLRHPPQTNIFSFEPKAVGKTMDWILFSVV